VTASGELTTGRTDFGPFFGFGARDVDPRSAQLVLQQPLFAGGSLKAGVAQAEAGQEAARQQAARARLELQAKVAEAYGAVLTAQEAFELNRKQVESLTEAARQADLRFTSGDAPRSDQAQAEARAAEARAGLAEAQAGLAQARARYRALTGQEPVRLDPFGPPPAIPGSLDQALAIAQANSPALAAARAGVDAAQAGVRQAQGGRLPEVALVAQASSVRDQFLPGYQADGYTVGVRARWTLFSSGLTSARVTEARARSRAADASAAEATVGVEEGVTGLWSAILAADLASEAARCQVAAAETAETSLGHEVKVAEKPLIDLLNAQRETLAARTALSRAKASQVVLRYRLLSLIGQAPPRVAD
jgi:outer membrane protein